MTTSSTSTQSLCELARANNASVRLRNSLENAAAIGNLPFTTVSEYLDSAAPIETMLRVVRNFGRRSAQELDRMVRDIAPLRDDCLTDEQGQPEEAEVADQLVALWSEIGAVPVRMMLSRISVGSRLGRVLKSPVGEVTTAVAIDDPESVRCQVVRVEAAGHVTADELVLELRLSVSRYLRESGRSSPVHDALMSALFGSEPGPTWRPEDAVACKRSMAAEVMRDALGDAQCAVAFEGMVIPSRLRVLVSTAGVGDRNFADALLERAKFGVELGRVSNVGRKTIVEFWDFLWRRFALYLTTADVTPDDCDAVAALLEIDPLRLVPHPEDLALHSPLLGTSPDAGRVVIPSGLDDLLEFLLERIREQDAPIIRRRFGLGCPSEKLEEIGVTLKVTRERIRQLEKRGLSDMRVISGRVNLRGALDAEWERAWDALADGDDLVTDVEFASFRRNIPGSFTLALELLDVDLSDWLSQISHRFPFGWLAPHRELELVSDAIAALEALPESLPLPRSLGELRLPGARPDIDAAVLIGQGLRTLHGYLVSGRIGTRRRRSLVAHALLARSGKPMLLPELLRIYHGAAPCDPCSMRDLTIVMSDAPHLFIEVSEGRWAGIGAGGEIPPGGRPREMDVSEDVSTEQDVTVAAAIRDELERAGPQSLSSLSENSQRYLPRDRSRNSVQPTLITRPDVFARLLPGVYSLWSQIPTREEVLQGEVRYLLDEPQARLFAMARRAGEPWGAFPLWSPEAEYRLCRWAVREASLEVRRSLLATATVDVWPIEAEERSEWRSLCARDGRYDLVAAIRPNVFASRPDLDRLLAALIDLELCGRTSWMTLNRVDGRHVGSQLGCGLLAILLLIGAVIPSDQAADSAWQLSHGISSGPAAEVRSALAAELHATGTLEWTSEAGHMVANLVLAGEDRTPAWLPFRRFSALFRIITPESDGSTEINPEIASDVGRALLAERRMSDLLQWLDDN